MAKSVLNYEHMKNEQVTVGEGVMVNTTDILDGAASDSDVMDAVNSTVQYKTPALDKGDLGGRNNLNG